jgi:hypothetical protein
MVGMAPWPAPYAIHPDNKIVKKKQSNIAMHRSSFSAVYCPRFMLLVHHSDAVREYADHRKSHIGRLDKALDATGRQGWTVVDRQCDWKVVYPFTQH